MLDINIENGEAICREREKVTLVTIYIMSVVQGWGLVYVKSDRYTAKLATVDTKDRAVLGWVQRHNDQKNTKWDRGVSNESLKVTMFQSHVPFT